MTPAERSTNSSGNLSGQRAHYPYRETWYETGTTKWKFTTHERDSESSNDYAMARTYVNCLFRFSSLTQVQLPASPNLSSVVHTDFGALNRPTLRF